MVKFHIKKGDTVIVLSGAYKNKIGSILKMFPKEGKALVQGINIIKKRLKPSAKNPKGGVIKTEGKIYISKLALLDPDLKKPTRVGFSLDDNGVKVRISKKSGKVI